MKQEVINDICARLPYEIFIHYVYRDIRGKEWPTDLNLTHFASDVESVVEFLEDVEVENPKPYLRPMSSMTNEEHGRYMEFIEWSHNDYDGTTTTCINKERLHEYLDFIYSHHLDDNNFIEKDLALEAPENMYKQEKI